MSKSKLAIGWVLSLLAFSFLQAPVSAGIGQIEDVIRSAFGGTISVTSPADNEVLTFDTASGTWDAEATAAGPTPTLQAVSDAGATTTTALSMTGANTIGANGVTTTFTGTTDVTISDGDVTLSTVSASDGNSKFTFLNSFGGISIQSSVNFDGQSTILKAFARLSESNTDVAADPHIISRATDLMGFFDNIGSTAENHHNLNAANAGDQYGFVVADADGIQINATASDTIRIGGQVSAANGFISSSTIGDVIVLTGDRSGTNWNATSIIGNWKIDDNPTATIFDEGAAPPTPASGKVALYAGTDGLLRSKDDAGAESIVSVGAWKAWTPVFTGFSAAPVVNAARFVVVGKTTVVARLNTNNGTSNATTFTVTLPVAASSTAKQHCLISVATSNGTSQPNAGLLITRTGSTTADLFTAPDSSAWSNIGGKKAQFKIIYESN